MKLITITHYLFTVYISLHSFIPMHTHTGLNLGDLAGALSLLRNTAPGNAGPSSTRTQPQQPPQQPVTPPVTQQNQPTIQPPVEQNHPIIQPPVQQNLPNNPIAPMECGH